MRSEMSLVIVLSSRTTLDAIDREIGISVVTRLIKLCEIGAFSFAQLTLFYAT